MPSKNSLCLKAKLQFSTMILAVTMVNACGWVESAGEPDQPGPLLLSLSGNADISQLDLTAESTRNVDLSVLQRDLGVENSNVIWRSVGAGDVAACSTITNRSDVGTSLSATCDHSQYESTEDVTNVAAVATSASEPDSCSVFIVEVASDTIGSIAEQSVYSIHTPALASPVALGYVIDFIQGNGNSLSYPVNLCIQP